MVYKLYTIFITSLYMKRETSYPIKIPWKNCLGDSFIVVLLLPEEFFYPPIGTSVIVSLPGIGWISKESHFYGRFLRLAMLPHED